MAAEWFRERDVESALESEMGSFSLERVRYQGERRRATLEQLSKTGHCGEEINFGVVETYLNTPEDKRTEVDTKQFKFTLKNLSEAFGERHVAAMYRAWQRTPKIK